jgi:hypothetical protein
LKQGEHRDAPSEHDLRIEENSGGVQVDRARRQTEQENPDYVGPGPRSFQGADRAKA